MDKKFLLFVGALIVVGIIVFGVMTVTSAVDSTVQAAREAACRTQCRNNIKQIALAMHNYYDANKCFPPAYTVDEQGKPMHSWRALLLPYLGGAAGYDYNQPWDSPANLEFAKTSPAHQLFVCPTENRTESENFNTSYVVIIGPDTFAEGTTPRTFAQFRDGTSNTIMFVEMSHSGILWTEPRDLNVEEMSYKFNDPDKPCPRSDHGNGLLVALCDGSTRFFPDSTDPEMVKALTTIDGGEEIDIQ